MKTLTLYILFIFAASSAAGEPALNLPRVVRIYPLKKSFAIRVNEAEPVQVGADVLASGLKGLSLQFGDIVVIHNREFEESLMKTPWWPALAERWRTTRVAVYVANTTTRYDVRDIPVYHWKSTFDDPRTLSDAVLFLRTGRLLGRGKEGLERLVKEIINEKPKAALFLGSLYDQTSGHSPFESPFELDDFGLRNAAEKSGTEVLRLSPRP